MKNKNKIEKSALEEEAVKTPMKQAIASFFSSYLNVGALVVFTLVLLSTFVLSVFYPLDTTYAEKSTQANIPPGLSMLTIPGKVKNDLQMIAVGPTYSVGLDGKGSPVIWGKAPNSVKKIPTSAKNLVMVAAGNEHVIALNDFGEIVEWGSRRFTGLGPDINPKWGDITSVYAGFQYGAALTDAGYLYLWGNTNFGIDQDLIPEAYQGHIVKISNASTNIIALLDDGTAVILGDANSALATSIPSEVQTSEIVDVAISDRAALVLTKEGNLIAWGQQRYGETDIPEELQGNVSEIFAGQYHFTAITNDRNAVSWGRNTFNQATAPSSAQQGNVVSVFTGDLANYAKLDDGKIVSWGLKGYLLGTDYLGRDIFTRLVNGGRITLTVGIIAVIVMTIIGVALGALAGFYGGKVDNLIMRLGEIFSVIPSLPIIIVLSGIIGNQMTQILKISLIMFIFGLLSWPGVMRMIRGVILAEREKEFVLSAKALGIRESKIIIRHILPNVITLIIIQVTLQYASFMLVETTLSFLGFGVSEPFASWGNMLSSSIKNIREIETYWWAWVFPAIAISISAISVNLIGDGIRSAVDPKSSER